MIEKSITYWWQEILIAIASKKGRFGNIILDLIYIPNVYSSDICN